MTRARDTASIFAADGSLNISTSVNLGDNEKAYFGTSNDLQIYHDGTHSYIYENGTGSLRIRATEFDVQQLSNGNSLFKTDGSSAQLLENGTLRLETTSAGVTVTGVNINVTSSDIYQTAVNIDNTDTGGRHWGLHSTGSTNTAGRFRIYDYDANVERMTIDSSGNVGIGTTSPLSSLHIDAANGAENFIRLHDGNSSYGYAMGLGSSGDYIISKYDGGSAVEALRVKRTNGNIGINHTSPTNKLHIRNTTHESSITGAVDSGSIKFHSQSGSYTNGDYYGGIVWARPNSNGGTPTTFIASKITNSGAAADLVFGADTATTVTERMRIDNAGRVTMPYQPAFEVTAPSAIAAGNYMVYNTVTTNRGNHWNSSSNAFVAPVDGFYSFAFHQFTDRTTTTGDTYWDVVVNGTFRNRLYQAKDGTANTHMQVNAAFNLYLSANDSVSMYYVSGVANSAGGTSHNKFSGFLVG